MVTDGILSAEQGMTDRFDTTEAKNAGNAIFESLLILMKACGRNLQIHMLWMHG